MKTIFTSAIFLSALLAGAQVEIDQSINLTGVDGQRKITNLELPVDGADAANKDYVDTSVSASGGGGLPTMITDESATTMNFGAAIRHCHDLNQSGFSDWRLPTYRELISSLSNGNVTVTNPSSSNYILFADPLIYNNGGLLLSLFRLSDGTFSGNWNYEPIIGRVRCVR